MDGNVENRITDHLMENDPEFKSNLDEYQSMAAQFEELIDKQVLPQYDDLHYRKLLLEEMKLVQAFKEGFLMATKVSQEIATKQNLNELTQ